MVTKEKWTSIMRAAGFSEEDMRRWHKEFEKSAPQEHQEFLEFLHIPPAEIKTNAITQVTSRIERIIQIVASRSWLKKHRAPWDSRPSTCLPDPGRGISGGSNGAPMLKTPKIQSNNLAVRHTRRHAPCRNVGNGSGAIKADRVAVE